MFSVIFIKFKFKSELLAARVIDGCPLFLHTPPSSALMNTKAPTILGEVAFFIWL